MDTEQHKQQLIALIKERRQEDCRNILDDAKLKSRELISEAYRKARQHVHDIVKSERARAVTQVRAVEAELYTKRRALEQRVAEQFIKQGWILLEQKLKKQWLQDQGRQGWIRRCARQALTQLPLQQWTVKHPVNCSDDDLEYFKDLISKQSPETRIQLLVSNEIKAGLIIGSDQTYLDMSAAGLLADRLTVEGRLLALLHKAGEA